jgi:hypothetical protein
VTRAFRYANEALAFLLELAALAAVGVWGYHVGSGTAVKVGLAVALPVIVAVVWGLFAAPRARFTLPLWGVLLVKALVFAAATMALYATGYHGLALAFAVVVIVNTAILTAGRRQAV